MQQSVRFTSHPTRLGRALTKPTFVTHRTAPVARSNMSAKAGGAALSSEMQSALTAVRLASKLCKSVQKQLSQAEKMDKQDDSPVTVADYGAQVLVTWSLARSDPSVKVQMVAEEDSASLRTEGERSLLERITQLVNSAIKEVDPSAHLSPEDVLELIDLGASNGGPSGRHWVLDPIDGTRGFVGMRQYSVCLGLLVEGEVKLGVLGCPNLPLDQVTEDTGDEKAMSRSDNEGVGSLFYAQRGSGAWVASLWEEGGSVSSARQVSVKDPQASFAEARFMESFETRHSNHSMTATMAKEVGISLPPLRMDSQVKYGLLSRGDASVFMRFPPPAYKEKIWDHAAGTVIVEEAGGKVTNSNGDRLDFSKGRYLDLGSPQGIIAGPPDVHAALMTGFEKVSPQFENLTEQVYSMEYAPTLIDASVGSILERVGSEPPLLRSSFSAAPADLVALLRSAPQAAELHAAYDAVRLAARLCTTVQHQLSTTEKMEKMDDSPVTVADYGAQALVAWSLSKFSPNTRLSMVAEEDSHALRSPSGQGLVERITQLVNSVLQVEEGEEGANPLTSNDVLELIDQGDSPGGPSGRHWVLDPIDGTKGFVGMRQYAICLALIQDGEVVVGVLGCPNIPQSTVTEEDGGPSAMAKAKKSDDVGSVFFAHQGYGAYVAPMWGNYSLHTLPNIQRIHVDDVPAPFTNARFMGAYESGHSNHGFSAALASKVGVSLPPFLMDSQAKYGILSRGDASVFMRFPPPSYREKIWDHAAGFVIVEEAGGKVTDAHGQRLDFSQGRELDTYGGIVAGPPLVHSAVLAAVLELGGPHNQ